VGLSPTAPRRQPRGRRRRGQAYHSLERLLLHPGLLDADMDLDLRDLDDDRRWRCSSGGSSRSQPGGSALPTFVFLELTWRICIKERECIFALPLSLVANLHCHLQRLLEPKSATHSTRRVPFLPLPPSFGLSLSYI
jgi:hypothetical protein